MTSRPETLDDRPAIATLEELEQQNNDQLLQVPSSVAFHIIVWVLSPPNDLGDQVDIV